MSLSGPLQYLSSVFCVLTVKSSFAEQDRVTDEGRWGEAKGQNTVDSSRKTVLPKRCELTQMFSQSGLKRIFGRDIVV